MNTPAVGPTADGLNLAALSICRSSIKRAQSLGIQYHQLPCGTHLLDFGVHCFGGLAAGIELAKITLADAAEVSIVPGDRQISNGPWVQVSTERPLAGCMFSQYAGWPVQKDKFFAMGSGPMRSRRGREEVLQHYQAHDSASEAANDHQPVAVGSLECEALPDCEVAKSIAADCQVDPKNLWIAVAPTRSLAGCVQVVARSIETSLHKLHELGFDLLQVRSAYGIAPVPPPTPSMAAGIGRTNDAILYAGSVTLWVDAEDEALQSVGPKLPSNSSCDFGVPFAEIFKRYNYDFYKVDPGLFSPAMVTLANLKTGRSWSYGAMRPDLITRSFGTQYTSNIPSEPC